MRFKANLCFDTSPLVVDLSGDRILNIKVIADADGGKVVSVGGHSLLGLENAGGRRVG